MQDIRKINSMQLYYLWRNLAVSLLCVAAVMGGAHVLPCYMAPAISLILCGVLYTMIWNNNVSDRGGCMLVVETMFYSLLGYTFVSIFLVLLDFFGLCAMPNEIVFFNEPYLPSLILIPVSFAVSLFALVFRTSMPSYVRFRRRTGEEKELGYFGLVYTRETSVQLKNMVGLFAALSVILWYYYLNVYVSINQNGRDWYVFLWIVVIAVMLDEVYFMMRYFNLYLDFQEHNEIITPEEVRDVTAHTYLRFYVICGEYVFIDNEAFDRLNQKEKVYDTPFITKRPVNGIPTSEVKTIVERMTGHPGGELRFFFGRHLAGIEKHSLLRYFYFLDGDISDYPDMGAKGKWVSFDDVKKTYEKMPQTMATNAVRDLSRLFTIILTERTYNEDGQRKNKIKSYKSTVTLADVRHSRLDLQDDKWLHVADFNSDTRFFRLKKFFRGLSGKNSRRAYDK